MLKLAVAQTRQDLNTSNVDPVVLGDRVRALRLNLKWTQKRLAGLAHVTENTIRGLEKGRTETRRPKVEAIATALGTTVELLLRVDQPIVENHPLLVGLNDDDLRIAQAYSRARTPIRLRVERLLLTAAAEELSLSERLGALSPDDQAIVWDTLTEVERAASKEHDRRTRKSTPPR